MPERIPLYSGDSPIYRLLRGDALRNRGWLRYALAVVLCAAATELRLLILPVVAGFPLVTFFPAVLVSAFLFGAGPCLLATALCAVAADLYFIPASTLNGVGYATAPLLGFCVYGVLLSVVAYYTRAALFELSSSEQKFRAFFALSDVGLVRADLSGRILEFNSALTAMTGHSATELHELDLWKLTPPEFHEQLRAQVEQLLVCGRFGPYEQVFSRKDGSRVPVEVRGMLVDAPLGERFVWSAVEDISARKAAAAALAAGEARLRTVFAAMIEGLVVHGADGRVTDANPAAEQVLGLTRDQLLGRTSMDLAWRATREDGTPFPGQEHPAMVSLSTGQPQRGRVMGVQTDGAAPRWISINSQPVFDAGPDKPSGVVATFADITDQVRLTRELREARSDLQSILDNMPARITSWDLDGRNRYANRRAAEFFLRDGGSATGRHLVDVVGMERDGNARAHIEAALGGTVSSHEQEDLHRDGTIRYSKVDYVPHWLDGRVVGFYALGADITELHVLLARIRELSQRLETVREDERHHVAQTLHEGVAQDLFALRLGLRQLAGRSGDPAAVADACVELEHVINKCIADTRQIAQDLQPAALAFVPLATALAQHADYFGDLAGLRISVSAEPGGTEPDEAARLLLFRTAQEALTNVARHARATRVRVVLRESAGQWIMTLSDDGCGIAPGALKKPGALGLLGIRERFVASGGTLAVGRGESGGTTLTVTLPLATAAARRQGDDDSTRVRDASGS